MNLFTHRAYVTNFLNRICDVDSGTKALNLSHGAIAQVVEHLSEVLGPGATLLT